MASLQIWREKKGAQNCRLIWREAKMRAMKGYFCEFSIFYIYKNDFFYSNNQTL